MSQRHYTAMEEIGFDFAFEREQPIPSGREALATPGNPFEREIALVEREIRNFEMLSLTCFAPHRCTE